MSEGEKKDTRKIGEIGRAIAEGRYTVVDSVLVALPGEDVCDGHGGVDFCGESFCRCNDGHVILTG